MTPREGVETKCPNYDGHLDRMVRDGRLGFSDIIHFVEGAWGDGYLAGRAAHPAATAREEAWRALLAYAECVEAWSGKSLDWEPTFIRHGWDASAPVMPFLASLRTRALALARSTGGT